MRGLVPSFGSRVVATLSVVRDPAGRARGGQGASKPGRPAR
jgi:hypothetical protein